MRWRGCKKGQNIVARWDSQFLARRTPLGRGPMQRYPKVGWSRRATDRSFSSHPECHVIYCVYIDGFLDRARVWVACVQRCFAILSKAADCSASNYKDAATIRFL